MSKRFETFKKQSNAHLVGIAENCVQSDEFLSQKSNAVQSLNMKKRVDEIFPENS